MTYLHSFGPRHPCSSLFASVTAPLKQKKKKRKEKNICEKFSTVYREADHEDASEDNDEGLVDMDDEEDKDESSFDERLGGSSATLLNTP